eukprot:gnl/MRDRNA2_/MRDRNA2_87082_c0_seq1.p1 gnl/MRDRNA2_/MRDRNA2_87082_c0~~gnl/MRDRNA2_/MRDRNA2_87082_c0_seq1.p1  ORF type:complete len:258 (-),score=44.80 gnl/MRDRNA2_/MRDRNA2_87082_c0_seq1:47-820(-)
MLCFAILGFSVQLTSGAQSQTRMEGMRRGIIALPGYDHRLRVCNAFTDNYPLSLVLQKKSGDKQKEINLTSTGPLSYKHCHDYNSEQVSRGDSVEVKVKEEHLGSFAVSALPRRRALLLLVVHRKKGSKTMPAFTSHIFADVPHAQVAILDMYQGQSKSRILIADEQSGKDARKEALAYDSVVAINSGKYKCVLQGGAKKEVPLSADSSGSYVAIRVGTEGDSSFPEDILIFPQEKDAASHLPVTLVFLLGSLWWLF